jgi:hypothetical protein
MHSVSVFRGLDDQIPCHRIPSVGTTSYMRRHCVPDTSSSLVQSYYHHGLHSAGGISDVSHPRLPSRMDKAEAWEAITNSFDEYPQGRHTFSHTLSTTSKHAFRTLLRSWLVFQQICVRNQARAAVPLPGDLGPLMLSRASDADCIVLQGRCYRLLLSAYDTVVCDSRLCCFGPFMQIPADSLPGWARPTWSVIRTSSWRYSIKRFKI